MEKEKFLEILSSLSFVVREQFEVKNKDHIEVALFDYQASNNTIIHMIGDDGVCAGYLSKNNEILVGYISGSSWVSYGSQDDTWVIGNIVTHLNPALKLELRAATIEFLKSHNIEL